MKYIESTKYATLTTVDLAGFRWVVAIIFETIERNNTLWNSIEYQARFYFLKQAFELVFYRNLYNVHPILVQHVMYEFDYKVHDKRPTSIKVLFALS